MSKYSGFWGNDDYTSEYDTYGSYGYGYGNRGSTKKKQSIAHIRGNQVYGQTILGV